MMTVLLYLVKVTYKYIVFLYWVHVHNARLNLHSNQTPPDPGGGYGVPFRRWLRLSGSYTISLTADNRV